MKKKLALTETEFDFIETVRNYKKELSRRLTRIKMVY